MRITHHVKTVIVLGSCRATLVAMIAPPRKILLPWEKIEREWRWINVGQGQSFVLTYLAKHPDVVEPGATLAGIEVAMPSENPQAPRVDLVLLKDGEYFVVEVKDRAYDLDRGAEEAIRYAEALKAHLDQNGIPYKRIVPVAAAIKFPRGEAYGPKVGSPTR